MRRIPFLFAFDKAMEMPAGVAITSLLENAAPETFYDIFILHNPECDFSGSLLNALPERYNNCKITFRKIEGEFVNSYEVRGISTLTYYRLIAPEFIPEYDKILYSDVDVIFREDLSSYYDIDLGDNYFAGVDNCSRFRPEVRDYIGNKLGLDWHKGYFYAGNIIINSAQLLKDNKINTFRTLGRNNYPQQDMDIMNIACNGRITPIGPSFCLTVQLYNLIMTKKEEMIKIYGEEEINHALHSGIVHYNGTKPWQDLCPNMDIWWAYYRRSLFYDEEFTHRFWENRTYYLEKMSLMKRIKLVGRYFRKGGRM